MKKQFILFCIISALMSVQKLGAQLMLKAGGGMLIRSSTETLAVFDLGLECKLTKHLSTQVSWTAHGDTGEELSRFQKILSPHVRYYFGENWLRAPYLGVVFQYYTSREEYRVANDIFLRNRTSRRTGGGLMAGYQFKFSRRFGVDFHVGFVQQKGSEKEFNIISTAPVAQTKVLSETDNKSYSRAIWGLNLFAYLGKMEEE